MKYGESGQYQQIFRRGSANVANGGYGVATGQLFNVKAL